MVNWRRYTKKGEEKVKELKRDKDGTIRENLIIKGNNLLAYSYSFDESTVEDINRVISKIYFLRDPHEAHPDWPDKTWEALKKRTLYVDMERDAVLAIMGSPVDMNTSVGPYGKHEQFIYGFYDNRKYIYIENDKVASWSY